MKTLTTLQKACLEDFYRQEVGLPTKNRKHQARVIKWLILNKLIYNSPRIPTNKGINTLKANQSSVFVERQRKVDQTIENELNNVIYVDFVAKKRVS